MMPQSRRRRFRDERLSPAFPPAEAFLGAFAIGAHANPYLVESVPQADNLDFWSVF